MAITVQSRSPYAVWRELKVTKASEEFTLDLPAPALRIDLDPNFDVFRRLDRREIPSSLGQIFGAENMCIVYATNVPPRHVQYFKFLAESWSRGRKAEVVSDKEMSRIPKDASIWFVGPVEVDNFPWKIIFQSTPPQIRKFDSNSHSVVLTAQHPKNPDWQLVGLKTGPISANAALARKIASLQKYSYLAFKEMLQIMYGKVSGRFKTLRCHISDIFGCSCGKISQTNAFSRTSFL